MRVLAGSALTAAFVGSLLVAVLASGTLLARVVGALTCAFALSVRLALAFTLAVTTALWLPFPNSRSPIGWRFLEQTLCPNVDAV